MKNLYHETALPKHDTATLDGALVADAIIVGGGYTGISTALHLAERGLRPVLLEAGDLAHGCSGRNGGQVNPGLKLLPDDLKAKYGEVQAEQLIRLSDNAPSAVFELIEKHDIRCAPMRTGTIRAAIDDKGEDHISAFVTQSHKNGAPARLIDEAGMRELTGTGLYRAGSFDPRGGHINPLAYARGLAHAAERAGAKLFTNSRVLTVTKQTGGWSVRTKDGTVSAPELIIATNGYTDDLWPGLKRTIIPLYSYITATEPLPDVLRTAILPSRAALYELSWGVIYYRIDDAGRLLMGGRGAQREAAGPEDYRHLIRHALKLWPQLKSVSWPWHWYGQVAVTQDHLPHLIEPEKGVHLMLGYNGRGIAMATVAGREIAAHIASGRTEAVALPVTDRLSPYPFHRCWRVGANLQIIRHKISDHLLKR